MIGAGHEMINKEGLYRCLGELADAEFQERAWVRGLGDEVSSFAELVCQTFDDTGVSDAVDDGSLSDDVGDELAQILIRLDAAVDRVDSNSPPDVMVKSEPMRLVRALSLEASIALGENI